MIEHNAGIFLKRSLLTMAVIFYSGTALSALYGDSHWQVEKGDSVYSIARKVFPDDAAKQRQLRDELVAENPSVFKGNANRLSIGDRLRLPEFAVSQPVPVVMPEVAEPVIVQQQALPLAEAVVTEEVVTPDPEEVIGHVVISVGQMQASNRGVFRKLLRHSEVLKGDTLTTTKAAYTQIRMKDGALISLRPDTQLKITDYRFNGEQDGSERSFMELISGGFRTITGYIGHLNKQNYRVKTAVATIGIRGTHYGLMVCAGGSCKAESDGLEDGVYGGVVDGSIVVQNQTGETTFNNDQYFYVASLFQSPVEQLVPPPVFHGKSEKLAARHKKEDSHDISADSNEENGNGNQEKSKAAVKLLAEGRVSLKKIKGDRLGALMQSYVDDQRPPVILQDQASDAIKDAPAVNTAPDGSAMLIAFTGEDFTAGVLDPVAEDVFIAPVNNNEIVLGTKVTTGGLVIRNLPIAGHEISDGTVHNLVLPSGVAGISDIGGLGNNAIGVNWGRWSDNYVLTENGVPQKTFADLHYIYSDKLTRPTEFAALTMPVNLGGLTSSETYTYAGGTIPTNAAGAAVQLTSLTVVSDFQNQSINYNVQAQDQGAAFNMSAVGVPFTGMSSFQLTDTGCNLTCAGSASAAFVGSQAEGLMTTYSLTEGTGPKGANGAAVLTRDSAIVIPIQ